MYTDLGYKHKKVSSGFYNLKYSFTFYFYNTKEEIDQFIDVCKKGDDFLDAFFG